MKLKFEGGNLIAYPKTKFVKAIFQKLFRNKFKNGIIIYHPNTKFKQMILQNMFRVRFISTSDKIMGLFKPLLRMKRWHVVIDLINHYDAKSYAEIGVEYGDTAGRVLKKCKGLKKIYAIDSYPIYAHCTQEMQDARYTIAKSRMNDKKVVFLKISSEEASKKIKDNELDVVFLDANHSYKAVKHDISLWLPKIKPNGILIGHDYNLRNFGVVRAVNEKFDMGYVCVTDDAVWWIQKSTNPNEQKHPG